MNNPLEYYDDYSGKTEMFKRRFITSLTLSFFIDRTTRSPILNFTKGDTLQ